MPILTELLRAEGLEITPELAAKLPMLVEASDEIRGLVATKNDLHTWKETNKPIIDAREIEIQTQKESAAADLDAREKLAIENKDFKAQLEIQGKREVLRDAELKVLQDNMKVKSEESRKSKQAENEALISAMFGSEYRGKLYAKDFVKSSLGDDDTVTIEYHINGKVLTDIEELKAEMVSTPELASEMKAPNSKGAPILGANNGGNLVKKPNEMNSTERVEFKQRDPDGFKKAFNL